MPAISRQCPTSPTWDEDGVDVIPGYDVGQDSQVLTCAFWNTLRLQSEANCRVLTNSHGCPDPGGSFLLKL